MTKRKGEFRASGRFDPPPFDVVVQFEDDSTLSLELKGELDVATAPILESRLASVAGLSDGDGQKVVYHLSRLTFMDATGLKALLSPWEGTRPHTVTVREASPLVRRLFGIVGLESMIDDRDDGTTS